MIMVIHNDYADNAHDYCQYFLTLHHLAMSGDENSADCTDGKADSGSWN